MNPAPSARWLVRVTGTVQGVGFRPFVYRHAVRLGLTGSVRNDSAGVLVDAEGRPEDLVELGRLLVDQPPPLALVAGVSITEMEPSAGDFGHGAGRFVIEHSADDGTADVPVSVDTATCADCLAEIDDPGDRRYRYPFTNCTNCGPRYTIVVSVPYDRPATTMAGFDMCPDCLREYNDPADRRFHAQPNACAACGPALRYLGLPVGAAPTYVEGPLGAAIAALRAGAVVAIKGVGGFHLAVDATNPEAVAVLRRRKARDDKPFAVLVADLAAAEALIQLSDLAVSALVSPRRPIVLAPRRPGGSIAPAVAPGLAELGVMLPYTPLHHLLIGGVGGPLVLTSGNLSDDPIAYTDDDAITRLGPMVDGILTHDRPIHIRCDDSVVRAVGRGVTGGPSLQVLRRSRGYAPEPIGIGFTSSRQVLAVGAELKSTISVAKGDHVVASHHIGDLEHLATYRSFVQAIDHLCRLCGVVPDVVAHDLHPEYLSTKLALEMGLPTLAVQHHHAHVASCLVDHDNPGPVLGVAYDGLGYGDDGTLWGGEFLVVDLDGYRRVGHLRPVGLPGGGAAIREPWRMAVAWARAACGPDVAMEVGSRLDPRAASLLALMESPPPGTVPLTSSMGRLFDAVAAMTTGRRRASYEGQAAIELEALAYRAGPRRSGRVSGCARSPARGSFVPSSEGGTLILDPAALVGAVIDDLRRGASAQSVAAAFHDEVAAGTVAAAAALAGEYGLGTVALSGGVFQNAQLSTTVEAGLTALGLEVLVHHRIPPNDGGISIGQAAIAAHRR